MDWGLKMTFKLKTLIAGAVTLGFAAMPAFADAKTEQFVSSNANEVLASLNDPSLDRSARTAAFNGYMDEFTDMRAISRFVIGKYSRRFTDAEFDEYSDAFRRYTLAVYESQLDRFRGNEIVVLGSEDDSSGRVSVVKSVIPQPDGNNFDLEWRVFNRNGSYQVMDVAMNFDGQHIWLSIEQRAQFLALLDQQNGSARALINKINSMTAKLESEKPNGREAALSYDADTNPRNQ